MLLVFRIYSPELFLEHVSTAGSKAFGIVPPFKVVDHVLLRLSSAVHEPWLMSLPSLRSAVLPGKVDFKELPDILPEMIRAWPDIRAFLKLNCMKYLTHRAVEAHGIDGVIWSDVYRGPRLALFYVLVLCYKASFKSQFESGLDDASCRNYGELCYFTWNLLSKVKRVADLPEAMDWYAYMCKPSKTFPVFLPVIV